MQPTPDRRMDDRQPSLSALPSGTDPEHGEHGQPTQPAPSGAPTAHRRLRVDLNRSRYPRTATARLSPDESLKSSSRDALDRPRSFMDDLRWTLLVEEPLPDPSLLGHLRKRLNELINANLRYTFGQ